MSRHRLSWLLPLALAGACRPAEKTPAGPTNLVLITLDTLRADRLGCYGYERATTPRLDRFASEGARFVQAVSQVPLTLPSHSTMMTGKFPMGHGVRDNGTFRLSDDERTLAEILKDRSYETAAFVSSFVIDSRFGLAQGFDRYEDFDDEPGAGKRAMRGLSEVQRRGGDTAERAIEWLKAPRSGPFFLWVHLYDPHYPFEPPEPHRSRHLDPYDGEVSYTDEVVGRILDAVDARGVRDATLVLIAGDHGESLGEHGEELHSWFIYDSVLLVPVLARLPGRIRAGLVIEEQVRLTDLAPTALDLLGIAPSDRADMQGTSVARWLTEEEAPEELPAYSESLVANLQFGWGELKAVRSSGLKMIRAPAPELYDVSRDPRETENLVSQRASSARELLDRLDEMERRFEGPAVKNGGATIDEETARKLESLGYLSGRGAEATEESVRVDPKDKIAFFRRFNNELFRATDAIDAGRAEEALAVLKPLAHEVPGHSRVHHLLGQAYFDRGDYSRAAGEFEVVVGREPNFSQARASLAQSYVLLGQARRAEEVLKSQLEEQPKNALLLFNLGFAYHRQNKLELAREAYEKARAADDDHPQLLANLAMLYLQTERAQEAVALFEKLVSMQDEDALSWNNLGLARAMADRLPEAGDAFARAVELAPDNAAFRKNLALWLERSGRREEAERERARLRELESSSR